MDKHKHNFRGAKLRIRNTIRKHPRSSTCGIKTSPKDLKSANLIVKKLPPFFPRLFFRSANGKDRFGQLFERFQH